MTIVGVIIDGTVYPLQSELSIAQKKGWGNHHRLNPCDLGPTAAGEPALLIKILVCGDSGSNVLYST